MAVIRLRFLNNTEEVHRQSICYLSGASLYGTRHFKVGSGEGPYPTHAW